MSEYLGDLVLVCSGGTPAAAGAVVPTVDIKLTLNTAVTSRLYNNGWSEAMLAIDEPGSGDSGSSTPLACNDPSGSCHILGTGNGFGVYDGSPSRPNIFQSKVSGNTVTFPSVPMDALNTAGYVRVLRITNLRADAHYDRARIWR